MFLRTISLLLVTSWLALPAEAQIPFVGTCPDVAVMRDFDASRYLGKWYEAERYFAFFEFGGRCVTAQYSAGDNGAVNVLNKQLSSFTGVATEIKGEATQVSRSDEGKFAVRFPSLPVNFAAPYWVVGTDYDNYAVVWGCNDLGLLHARNAWILTREQNPSLSVLEKAYSVLDQNGISKAYFTRTDQRNCPEE